ncbi:hypothetical protein LJC46_00675 [Desulfovibrio sp. OttesenSCG-928-G15]|nr:hypothetical protein [Desulfovibrio sp. OttesenSCG-928-G15]
MAEVTDGRRIGSQGMVLALIISAATLAALALTLVWLNIERTKLAYRVRTLGHELAQVQDLNAKLSVEKEHLLSPYMLGKKAQELGLGTAKPGQIRRMYPPEETDSQNGESEAGGNESGL